MWGVAVQASNLSVVFREKPKGGRPCQVERLTLASLISWPLATLGHIGLDRFATEHVPLLCQAETEATSASGICRLWPILCEPYNIK